MDESQALYEISIILKTCVRCSPGCPVCKVLIVELGFQSANVSLPLGVTSSVRAPS